MVAGIISGCLVFALAVIVLTIKLIFQKKSYKFDYSSIKRTNHDDMLRSDYDVIKPDESSCTDMSHSVLIKGDKNCSDSGRGDSGEDDHSNHESSIMVIHEKSTNYYGSKYCTQDCYRLGHSDTCWLPTENDFGIDVTSKTTNQTNLSVCDRTSDYSSQKSIANNISSREVIV